MMPSNGQMLVPTSHSLFETPLHGMSGHFPPCYAFAIAIFAFQSRLAL